MKRLYILRHAKAAQAEPGQDDHARALTVRGIADAEAMARYLRKNGAKLDRVLISTSARTIQTADLVLREMEGPPRADYRDGLYLASAGKIVSVLKTLPGKFAECDGGGPQSRARGIGDIVGARAGAGARNVNGATSWTRNFPPPRWRSWISISRAGAISNRATGKLADFVRPKDLLDSQHRQPARAERQRLPAKRHFTHILAAQHRAAFGDARPTHRLIEEAGIVLRVAPDQAGMKGAGLQLGESAMQQRAAHAMAHEIRIDIKRIDFAIEAQPMVARGTKSGQTQHAMARRLRRQHRAFADGALQPGCMGLHRHVGKQAMRQDGGVRVPPSFDIDARQGDRISGTRESQTQSAITHAPERDATKSSPQGLNLHARSCV